MVLYQGMYNVAHFEINNNLQLYEDVLVGDEYDYKRLRKICFVSGSVYINKAIVNNSIIKGGAHVSIQDDSIFVNIVPEDENDGIVIGITFYLNENGDMYAYTEKREGGPGGTVVESFNGRTGQVVPSDTDYNAGLIGYDNTVSQLIATNAQDAIDELDQEVDQLFDDKLDAPDNANFGDAIIKRSDGWAAEPIANSFNGRTGSVVPANHDYDANQIDYDNTTSGLVASDVQEAVDIVKGLTDDLDEDKIDKPASANTDDVLTFDGTNWVASPLPTPSTGVTSFNSRTGAVSPTAHDYDADQIDYDNTTSGLAATDVQAALDEIANDVLTSGVVSFNSRTGTVLPAAHDYDADQVDYDNTVSQLTATDTQAAIDEVVSALGNKQNTLTFDSAPTAGSNNPVTSDGIKSAIDSQTRVETFNGRSGTVSPAAHDYDADQVDYDNTSSGLVATDVQGAVDEVNGKIPSITASTTDLTPGTSQLAAGAIYLYYTTT